MPKKKNNKVSKTKSKDIKGQLGKKKETDREKNDWPIYWL